MAGRKASIQGDNDPPPQTPGGGRSFFQGCGFTALPAPYCGTSFPRLTCPIREAGYTGFVQPVQTLRDEPHC